MYCPRRTKACVTSGSVLRPLLNQNQSVSVQSMDQSLDDVCYWELQLDTEQFKQDHPALALSDLFLNLVITGGKNVFFTQFQGTSRFNATNQTENAEYNKTYRYPLNQSSSVFLMAHPPFNNGQGNGVKASFNFTYNLTADYYPVQGMTIQLQAEIAPDIERKAFWIVLGVLSALFLVGLLLVMFVICCKDFDPDNDFEKRRKRLAKEQKIKDKQAKKQKAKDEKNLKKTKSQTETAKPKQDDTKKKTAKKHQSSEEEDNQSYDEEDQRPKKRGGKQQQEQQKTYKKPRKALETEVKLKDEKKQRRDDYKMPFLKDDSDEE